MRAVAVVLLGPTFYPLTRAFALGQIQTWLDVGTAALLLAWLSGKRALGGAIVGLMCLIKPQYAVVFVGSLVRRQWRMLGAGLPVVIAVGLLSVARFGLENHLDYLSTLRFLLRVGDSYNANQSLNGLLNRMLFIGDNVEWQENSWPPFDPVVYVVTVAGSVAFVVAALVFGWRHPQAGGVTDLSIMLLSLTMASPIAWEHHYGITFAMFAAALPAFLALRPFGELTGHLLTGTYLLISLRVSATERFAATRLDFVQSYLFFGAVAFLAFLYCLRRSEGRVWRR